MIYQIFHRYIPNAKTRWFTPIFVSNHENPNIKFTVKDKYPRMADMNLWYNELSAQYYIWKEDKTEYKGQVQYRRCFQISLIEAKDILEHCDFIVTVANIGNLKQQFLNAHDAKGEIWNTLVDILKSRGITDDVINEWSNSKDLYYRNMFIAKADDYNAYSEWLFDIIFEFEKRYNINTIDDVYRFDKEHPGLDPKPLSQCRMPGYLSERLFTLYLIMNAQTVMVLPTESLVEERIEYA